MELGNPHIDNHLLFSIHFTQNSFLMFFYNNIWDIDFISDFDPHTQKINKKLNFKVKNIRFLDFEYLDYFFKKYDKSKKIISQKEFDIKNIRNDFFMLLEFEEIGLVIGGNQLDFFNKNKKIDDNSLKELSNQWIVYLIDYKSEKNIFKKDSMCENNSLIK